MLAVGMDSVIQICRAGRGGGGEFGVEGWCVWGEADKLEAPNSASAWRCPQISHAGRMGSLSWKSLLSRYACGGGWE